MNVTKELHLGLLKLNIIKQFIKLDLSVQLDFLLKIGYNIIKECD